MIHCVRNWFLTGKDFYEKSIKGKANWNYWERMKVLKF